MDSTAAATADISALTNTGSGETATHGTGPNGVGLNGVRLHAAALTDTVSALEPGVLQAEIAGGWDPDDELDAMCRYAVRPPGKLFRPYLLLESCAAVGGEVEHAVPAALGAEYGHVASLIHDDIIDGDAMRRGRPSVPAAYGRDHAIVVGDTLLFRLFLALSECADRGVPADRIVASLRAVASAGVDLCRGQTSEAKLCGDAGAGLDAYFDTVRGKTAALFRGACEVGALLGGGTERQVAALASYGDQLGIAFQMVDDLLAYRSSSGVAGKDLLSDIRNRRMTFPLIVACRLGPPEVGQSLQRAFDDAAAGFGSEAAEVRTFELVQRLLAETDALAEAGRIVAQHAGTALDALGVLAPSPSRDRLAAMVTAAVERVE